MPVLSAEDPDADVHLSERNRWVAHEQEKAAAQQSHGAGVPAGEQAAADDKHKRTKDDYVALATAKTKELANKAAPVVQEVKTVAEEKYDQAAAAVSEVANAEETRVFASAYDHFKVPPVLSALGDVAGWWAGRISGYALDVAERNADLSNDVKGRVSYQQKARDLSKWMGMPVDFSLGAFEFNVGDKRAAETLKTKLIATLKEAGFPESDLQTSQNLSGDTLTVNRLAIDKMYSKLAEQKGTLHDSLMEQKRNGAKMAKALSEATGVLVHYSDKDNTFQFQGADSTDKIQAKMIAAGIPKTAIPTQGLVSQMGEALGGMGDATVSIAFDDGRRALEKMAKDKSKAENKGGNTHEALPSTNVPVPPTEKTLEPTSGIGRQNLSSKASFSGVLKGHHSSIVAARTDVEAAPQAEAKAIGVVAKQDVKRAPIQTYTA